MEPKDVVKHFTESMVRRDTSREITFTTTTLKFGVAFKKETDYSIEQNIEELAKEEIKKKVFNYLYGDIGLRLGKVECDLYDLLYSIMKKSRFDSYGDRLIVEEGMRRVQKSIRNVLEPGE